jgi:uncharacterized protein
VVKKQAMRISRKLFLICAALVAISAYYTISFAHIFFAEYSQYHPPRERINWPAGQLGSRLRDISIEIGDGTRVAGWSIPSHNGAMVIFIHGSPANRKQLLPIAAGLSEHGYGALLLDMPGHGESGGRADWGISSRIAVERAIDLVLKDDGVSHIAIFGYSMGSCIAVQVAAHDRRVNALILVSAFSSLADLSNSPVPFLNQFDLFAERMVGVDVDSMRTLDVLKTSMPRPVLIVSGTADTLIPVSMPKALFQAAHGPKELWLVEGANHGNVRETANSAFFDARVSIFLNKALFDSNVDYPRTSPGHDLLK